MISKPPLSSIIPTSFLPMSCKSPATVPNKTLPLNLRSPPKAVFNIVKAIFVASAAASTSGKNISPLCIFRPTTSMALINTSDIKNCGSCFSSRAAFTISSIPCTLPAIIALWICAVSIYPSPFFECDYNKKTANTVDVFAV